MKLIYGDALEEMDKLISQNIKVNAIITDPPYGSTPLDWDKKINLYLLWNKYRNIIKPNGAIVIFGQEPFSSYVRLSNIEWYKYDWYWQKERLTNVLQVKRRPGKVIETISVFYKSQCNYYPQKSKYTGSKRSNKISKNGNFSITLQRNEKGIKLINYKDDGTRYPIQLLQFNREKYSEVIHPTQKPVKLIEYLIKTYTKENDIILDNYMGSGTTGVACKNLNRDFIGIESNKKYFDIATKRINAPFKPRIFK